MALGELLLNRIPPMLLWGNGWVALWTFLYGVWSTIFYIMTGTYIYPFLNAHRPYAWVGYVGLYVVIIFANAVFYLLIRGRERLAAVVCAKGTQKSTKRTTSERKNTSAVALGEGVGRKSASKKKEEEKKGRSSREVIPQRVTRQSAATRENSLRL
jgi:hypothetical protein